MEYLQKYLIMIKKFLIKILWFFGRHTRIHLINRALTELNYNNIINSNKYSDDKNLINFGFKVYSQADEDGILEEIFKRIGVSQRKFIEFGIAIDPDTAIVIEQCNIGATSQRIQGMEACVAKA